MKQARIAFEGRVQQAWEDNGKVRLADGRRVEETEVVWLPPVTPGTIFALGLNYADHAAEIASKAPEEPMVFLKGANTLVGHRAFTPRPADATNMHYECELAIVVGKPARNVAKADAYDYIAGYTVANTTPCAITWKASTGPTSASRAGTIAPPSAPGWWTRRTFPTP